MIAVLSATGFVLGLTLLVVGLRGRRVGEEPHCRKCGYILTGIAIGRCPECGRALAARAVVFGVRRRRGRFLVLGLLALFGAAGAATPSVYRWARTFDLYPHLPFAWLMRTAKGGDIEAVAEIQRRLDARMLGPGPLAVVADHALALQVAPTADTFSVLWFDLLESMDQAGLFAGDRRIRYLQQLAAAEVRMRPRVRVGDPLPVYVTISARAPMRGGKTCVVQITDVRVGGAHVGRYGATCAAYVIGLNGRAECGAGFPLPDVAPGVLPVEITLDCAVYLPYALDQPIHRWEETRTVELTVLPAQAPDPTYPTAVHIRPGEVAANVTLTDLRVLHLGRDEVDASATFTLSWSGGLPVTLAHQVVLLTETGEIELGAITARPGDTGATGVRRLVREFVDEHVRVELRPDAPAARATVDLEGYWSGTLSFADVEVEHVDYDEPDGGS